MEIATHLGIDRSWCGEPMVVTEGAATVRLSTSAAMAADAQGLVHGGFVFGAADYAAMLAVNDPFVVLGAAETRFSPRFASVRRWTVRRSWCRPRRARTSSRSSRGSVTAWC